MTDAEIMKLVEDTIEPIPEDFPCGMCEVTPEEQAEVDAVIADLGIEI